MLKARLTADAFDALPDTDKAHYRAEGAGFVLVVEPVDGMALEDAGALKRALQAERRGKGMDPAQLDALQIENERLKAEMVKSKVNATITKELMGAGALSAGMVDLLAPALSAHVVEQEGELVVQDDGGMPRLGRDGQPMSIAELVREASTQYPEAFRGSGRSGMGCAGSPGGGGYSGFMSQVPASVASTDRDAVSRNIADIASGKVKVE